MAVKDERAAHSTLIGLLEHVHKVAFSDDHDEANDRRGDAQTDHDHICAWWPELRNIMGDPGLRALRGQSPLNEELLEDLLAGSDLDFNDEALTVLLCGPLMTLQDEMTRSAQLLAVAAAYRDALKRADPAMELTSTARSRLISHLYATLRFSVLTWQTGDPGPQPESRQISGYEWEAMDRNDRTQEALGKLLVLWPTPALLSNLTAQDAGAGPSWRPDLRESRLSTAAAYVARLQWPQSEADQTLWNSPALKLPLLKALRALSSASEDSRPGGANILPPALRGRPLSIQERAALQWSMNLRMRHDRQAHWIPGGLPDVPTSSAPNVNSTLTADGIENPQPHDATETLGGFLRVSALARDHLFEPGMIRQDLIRAAQGFGAASANHVPGINRLIHSLHEHGQFWDGYSEIEDELEDEDQCRVSLTHLCLAALRACVPGHPSREAHLSTAQAAELIIRAYPKIRSGQKIPPPTEQLRSRLTLLTSPLGVALHLMRLLLAPVKQGDLKYELEIALTRAWCVQAIDRGLSELKLAHIGSPDDGWREIVETICHLPRARHLLCPPCGSEEITAGQFGPDATTVLMDKITALTARKTGEST